MQWFLSICFINLFLWPSKFCNIHCRVPHYLMILKWGVVADGFWSVLQCQVLQSCSSKSAFLSLLILIAVYRIFYFLKLLESLLALCAHLKSRDSKYQQWTSWRCCGQGRLCLCLGISEGIGFTSGVCLIGFFLEIKPSQPGFVKTKLPFPALSMQTLNTWCTHGNSSWPQPSVGIPPPRLLWSLSLMKLLNWRRAFSPDTKSLCLLTSCSHSLSWTNHWPRPTISHGSMTSCTLRR